MTFPIKICDGNYVLEYHQRNEKEQLALCLVDGDLWWRHRTDTWSGKEDVDYDYASFANIGEFIEYVDMQDKIDEIADSFVDYINALLVTMEDEDVYQS